MSTSATKTVAYLASFAFACVMFAVGGNTYAEDTPNSLLAGSGPEFNTSMALLFGVLGLTPLVIATLVFNGRRN